ncbi:dihydrolipoamide acetyltransferase family protein [Nonomuraea lactucae]|uniref:dihydrolipoamide acetyltransferase family protein n=1 Tax=Nonomuraea lactucae TaxID=2249762 RepID=UPI000DE2DFDE|nr:dihydrolipoamide acetyltransferase family protein [Nonomuraea lactucae]
METGHSFTLPDVGEGLTEAEIVTWLVSVGDVISVNDPLVEIETAKATVEIPSPLAGRVDEILVPPGRTVPVGTPLVVIRPAGSPAPTEQPEPASTAQPAPEPASTQPRPSVLVGYGPAEPATRRRRLRNTGGDRGAATAEPAAPARVPRAKPPIRQLARRLGVELSDLPAGPDGLVTRKQVEEAGETRTPVKGVQKAMAAAMVASAFTAPHATLWLQVDMTATMGLVERLRRDKAWAGTRVTPLLILAKAVLLAALRHPFVNSSWDERRQEIVTHQGVNLGIAAATPRGLLDDMTGGTMTITNVGVFGVEGATPILNPGEAVIIAFGATRNMPWAVNDEIAIRAVATLAISIDHRVVDGERGSRFLADVARLLEHPAEALLYA